MKRRDLFFLVILTLLVQQNILPFFHTIAINGEWENAKVKLAKGVQGARSFELSHIPLLTNTLNLGNWWKFHEVWSKKKYDFSKITLKVKSDGRGPFFVLLKNERGEKWGFKFSSGPNSHKWLQLAPDGQFLHIKHLGHAPLPVDQWMNLELLRIGNKLEVSLAGSPVGSFLLPGGGPYAIGFKNYDNVVEIDDITFLEGKKLIRENFSPRYKVWWGLLATSFIIVFFSILLLGKCISTQEKLLLCSAFSVGLLFILTSNYIFHLKFHGNYKTIDPLLKMRLARYQTSIETEDQLIPKLKQKLKLLSQKNKRPLYLFGSSQSWGAGAYLATSSIEGQISSYLANNKFLNCYQFINFAVSGLAAHSLKDFIHYHFPHLPTGYAVINLGLNDQTNPKFGLEFPELLEEIAQFTSEVFLVGEPTYFLWGKGEPRPVERIVREQAQRKGYPYIDAQRELNLAAEDGQLWWDRAHLTSYGQSLLAKVINQNLLQYLPKCP